MATGTLEGSTIASTYKSILKVKGGANNVLDADPQLIEDGDGNDSVLGISTDSVLISGSGTRLDFNTDGSGEYISGDGTDLTIAAGTAVNITADVIDLSDATKDITLNAAVDALNFDSNTLSIDASNNRVGIGTAAPSVPLEVVGQTNLVAGTAIADDDASANGTASWSKSNCTLAHDTTWYEQTTNGNANGIAFLPNISYTSGKLYYMKVKIKDGSAASQPVSMYMYDGSGVQESETLTTTSAGFVEKMWIFKATNTTASGRAGFKVHNDLSGSNVEWQSFICYEYNAIGFNSDYDTAIGSPGDDTLSLVTAGEERMRIDSSGNVGIGTASPIANLDILGDEEALVVRTGDSGRVGIAIKNTDTGSDVNFTDGFIFKLDSDESAHISQSHDNYMAFHTNASEKMRITSAGNVGIGTDGPDSRLHVAGSGDTAIRLEKTDATTSEWVIVVSNTQFMIRDEKNTADIIAFDEAPGGTINLKGTAYTGSTDLQLDHAKNIVSVSDKNWKTDLGEIENGLEILNNLKPRYFKWKRDAQNNNLTDIEQPRLAGFFAQELYEALPEGSPGGSNLDEKGEEHWGMNSRAIIAVNTKSIQELSAKVEVEADYRLKENEISISDGLERLNQLKPYKFNFKTDPDKDVDGFFAHEVSDIVPEAIIGAKDAMKEEKVSYAIQAVEAVEAQDAVYETVTKQRQKVVVSEVEEEVSSTEIVLEDGKYVQKTTTETVTKEVETPQYEEVPLYDEDGEEVGTHTIPVMEDYEEEQLVSEAVEAVDAVDAVDAVSESVPDYQSIDQSKLVPLLVASVQELSAKVEALENA